MYWHCLSQIQKDSLHNQANLYGKPFFSPKYGVNVDPEDGVLSNRPVYSDDTKLTIPFNFPSFALSKPTILAFNQLYYNKQLKKKVSGKVHYEPFLYPLDSILNWNRIYGKNGFYQFQFVTPLDKKDTLKEVFKEIAKSGNGSFLAVLKKFSNIAKC